MSLKYRPEIDGLRAIAVMAVVLYHAEFSLFGQNPIKGGFIGVDIFFVISGFLITSIILKQVQAENYSFRNFYERRARRILPALFLVMLVSIPFAWKLMLPEALMDYAGSILSSLFFGSNIWFWQESSYWAGSSALKPFLHTWSLSIEEQFYVIFPFIVLFVWKFAKKYLLGILLIGFFVSLQVADHGSVANPDSTFYLLHSRAWELLAGAILAKISIDHGRLSHPLLDVTMPAIGLFFIVNAIFFFDSDLGHPSFITLLPVLGTMIIIWFGKTGEFVTDILSSKAFVWVGLISYSLYLWHFPIFAFAQIYSESQTDLTKLGLIGLSFLFATVAYYLVEQPARKPDVIAPKVFYTFLGSVFILLVGFNAAVLTSGGFSNRFAANAPNIAGFKPLEKRLESLANVESFGQNDVYEGGKIKVLVLGDSLSRDLWNSFHETKFLEKRASFRNFHAGTSCLIPLLNGSDFSKLSSTNPRVNKNCGKDFREKFETSKRVLDADIIIWMQLFNNKSTPQFRGFSDYLREFNPDATLVIANRNDVSFDKTPLKVLLTEKDASENEDLPALMAKHRTEKRDKARQDVQDMAKSESWIYLDVSKLACGEGLNRCDILDKNGNLLYFDAHHWTLEGAKYFGQKIAADTELKTLILNSKDKK